jgi:uncharacterized RDD family membrane protein YckC
MNRLKIIFAFFYDLLLLCALWFVATIPFLIWQGESFAQNPLMLLAFQIYLIAISYIYLTFFWMQNGQTPGLRTWKLQLQSEDGYLLTRHNSNLRFTLATLLFPIGWIGLLTPKKQLLQDILAKTKIVPIQP